MGVILNDPSPDHDKMQKQLAIAIERREIFQLPTMFQFVAVVAHVFSDIDVQNEDGDTALHLAAEFDQPSVIEALLKHKADFHKVHKCHDKY